MMNFLVDIPINMYTKEFVRTTGAEILQETGFTDLYSKGNCWCRLKSKDVINTFIFHCKMVHPVDLDLSYGIYPLYTELFLPKNVRIIDQPYDSRLHSGRLSFVHSPLFGNYSFAPLPPKDQVRFILKKAFQNMELINTEEDAYLWAKQITQNAYGKIKNGGQFLIEQAIYFDDTEIYPQLREKVNDVLQQIGDDIKRNPYSLRYRRDFEVWTLIHHALFDNARADFLVLLENRKKKNLALLENKHGLAASFTEQEIAPWNGTPFNP